MAEKNTESTAVNELIELVATAKPLPPDPSEDLMFRDAKPAKPRKLSTTRMSSTVPPVPLEPLPRARSPHGTQPAATLARPPTTPARTIKAQPPAIRVTTAPISRGPSIPPLTLDDDSDHDEVTNPGTAAPTITQRPTVPTLPPPIPSTRASGSGMRASGSGMRASGTSTSAASTNTRASGSGMRASLQKTRDFEYPIVQPPAATTPSRSPRSTPAPANMPVAAPFESVPPYLPPPRTSRSSAPAWHEHDIGTHQITKRQDWRAIVGRLIGPMVILVIVGVFIGGYFAFDGDGGKRKPQPAPVASPAGAVAADNNVGAGDPAGSVAGDTGGEAIADHASTSDEAPAAATAVDAPHAAHPAGDVGADVPVTPPNLANVRALEGAASASSSNATPAPSATGKLVDIRIDSDPSGATVMLLDRGKSTFLGTTPMRAAIDPSRKYELVFSRERRATVVEPLDPTVRDRVTVKLPRAKARRGGASVTPPAVEREAATPVAETQPPPTVKAAKAAKAKPTAIDNATLVEPKPERRPDAAKAEGTLRISSKPPCEIVIDGKHTGLMTPQRAITLPVGAHKITLVNGEAGIKKTLSVRITADQPTTVIQDFMK